jgi:predicted amidohydrolase
MYIQIGLAEKVKENEKFEIYNSVAIIGPDGLIGIFRKVHMAPNPVFKRGNKLSVFETKIGKIGPIICADLAYPETVRVLALKGAEIITMSTAWGMMGGVPYMDIKDDSWTFPGYYSGYRYDLLGKANALQNGVWLIMANQVSSPVRSEERCFGHSRIIDPSGRIIAGIGYGEGLITAEVDVAAGINTNRFKGRRPECYEEILVKN